MTACDSKSEARELWAEALQAALKARAVELAGHVQAQHHDPVAAALTAAIERAVDAGDWTSVAALARELEGRRRARADVVDLEAARARRGGR